MGSKKRKEPELSGRSRFEGLDDRATATYQFRGDVGKGIAHEVTAVEATQDDVDSGDAGAVGDFLVSRNGYAPQWWTRDTFLDQYEAV